MSKSEFGNCNCGKRCLEPAQKIQEQAQKTHREDRGLIWKKLKNNGQGDRMAAFLHMTFNMSNLYVSEGDERAPNYNHHAYRCKNGNKALYNRGCH